jgi:indole-3-glycerol phosphate synthase
VQASTNQWKPPAGVLGRILSDTRDRVAELRGRSHELEQRAAAAPVPPSFRAALIGDRLAVVAEIKRRSPSKGDINPTLTPAVQARAYSTGGAAAISVLTEPGSFGGSLNDLTEARRGTGLPLLRKDFIIDALQIAEARAAGASAVLLIARALPSEALVDLAAAARSYGVEALVEIRSEEELDGALALPVSVIGVNSRDLETLEVSTAVTAKLIPLIPSDRLAIAESGIATTADAVEASRLGADAILVGSALSSASDPAALVHSLAAVPRTGRARRD